MGLRIGLKQTSSFVRWWEILMWYISLKFQFKNYSLNLWKLTQEWCVQRNKGISKNRFKIKISIKILGYSVKFNERKKKERQKISGPQRNFILLRRLYLEKIMAHCNGWFAKICVYRENVLDERSWRYDWERCIRKMKGVSRSYLLTCTSSE